MADLIRLVDALVTRLKNGKTLVIHCNGGKGRSGTVAVACMVAMGQRVDKSIDVVRKARSGTIRNPVQIVYVKRFKSAFKKYIKKKKALIEARGGSASMPKEEWDALAQQVAADAVLESSSSSESDANSLEGATSSGAGRSSFALQKKYKKEEEKAHEKARKEEEKASERARKEEEKNRKEEEKAAEKARKEDEKLRKEEEKALGKQHKKEDSKRGSMQLSASFDSDVPSTTPGSGKNKTPNHAKTNSTAGKRSSTELDEDLTTAPENHESTGSSLPLSAVDPSNSALLAPIAESPGRAAPAEPKPKQAKKQEKRVDTPAPYAAVPAEAHPTLDNNQAAPAPAESSPTTATATGEENNVPSSPIPRSNSKKKAKRTALPQAEEAALSGAGSE